MKTTKEEFKLLSNKERLEVIQDLGCRLDVMEILELLSSIPMETLDAKLLGEFVRAYNNNDEYETAMAVLDMVEKEKRDALWYYRYAYSRTQLSEDLRYGDLEVDKLDIFQDLIQVKRSNKWPGTISGGSKAYVYSFEMTQNVKKFLSGYDSFFIVNGRCISTEAFDDQSDYSFFEKGTGDCLLFTITHEGEVFLRKDIYNRYFLEWNHQG